MERYHINSKGEASTCRAKAGKCPYGKSENHYLSKSEAREAFEKMNQTFPERVNGIDFSRINKIPLADFDDNAPDRFHICRDKDIDSILKYGLVPTIGINSETLGETVEGIYLFPDEITMNDANWLEDCFEDDEELTVLRVKGVAQEEDFYEIVVTGRLTPDRLEITDFKV